MNGQVAAGESRPRSGFSNASPRCGPLDTAAVYLALDTNLEVGVSLRFHPDKLPADAKKWLTGLGPFGEAASLVPKDAMFGVAGHIRAAELIDLVASLAPIEDGKPGVKEWIAQTLGPVVGRGTSAGARLARAELGSLGGAAAERFVLANTGRRNRDHGRRRGQSEGRKGTDQSLEFGFQTACVAYNARHTDQIEFRDDKDPTSGVVIRSLVNEKGFPKGLRPSFALAKGYLVLASSSEGIRRFEPRAAALPAGAGGTTVAFLSATRTREYLLAHGPRLAKFLASFGSVGDEKQTRETLETLASALELVDTIEVVSRPNEDGMRLAIRAKLAEPLAPPKK